MATFHGCNVELEICDLGNGAHQLANCSFWDDPEIGPMHVSAKPTRDERTDPICRLREMLRVDMGVNLRRLWSFVPKELTGHIQGFADHNRVAGIGVSKIMQSNVFR